MSEEYSDATWEAALEYLARKRGRLPRGFPDENGWWRPDDWSPSGAVKGVLNGYTGEARPCCEGHEPTGRNPAALRDHCRTPGHIANLFPGAVAAQIPELVEAIKVTERLNGKPVVEYAKPRVLDPTSVV